MPGGVALLRIRSMIIAHIGHEVVKLRYDFSQMISTASFLAWMFSRLRPPLLEGRYRYLRAILGDKSSSHIKL